MKKGNSKSGLTGIILCIVAIIVLKSVAPLIGKLLSVILTLAVIAVLIFCGFIVYYALKKSGDEDANPNAAKKQLDPSQSKVLSEGRSALAKLRTANLNVKDPAIKAKNDNICEIADRILAGLRRNPDKIADSVQLLKYYLPELADIVNKYTKTQVGEGAEETTAKLGEHLDKIASIMEKQYEAVVSDEKLDVTAEMEAMKMVLQMDGLDIPEPVIDEAAMLSKKYEDNPAEPVDVE